MTTRVLSYAEKASQEKDKRERNTLDRSKCMSLKFDETCYPNGLRRQDIWTLFEDVGIEFSTVDGFLIRLKTIVDITYKSRKTAIEVDQKLWNMKKGGRRDLPMHRLYIAENIPITIHGVPFPMKDEAIKEHFEENYGKITNKIEQLTDDKGMKNGMRRIFLKTSDIINNPVKSYIKIKGHTLFVKYWNQKPTCRICGSEDHLMEKCERYIPRNERIEVKRRETKETMVEKPEISGQTTVNETSNEYETTDQDITILKSKELVTFKNPRLNIKDKPMNKKTSDGSGSIENEKDENIQSTPANYIVITNDENGDSETKFRSELFGNLSEISAEDSDKEIRDVSVNTESQQDIMPLDASKNNDEESKKESSVGSTIEYIKTINIDINKDSVTKNSDENSTKSPKSQSPKKKKKRLKSRTMTLEQARKFIDEEMDTD
uniref:uncharacterized protein LOC120347065 n=1 Tax=Styela clava TaxID=7725 RepID=UPI001939FCD7|nr:uncharacterized protein LOC120347065 [Styela clava]